MNYFDSIGIGSLTPGECLCFYLIVSLLGAFAFWWLFWALFDHFYKPHKMLRELPQLLFIIGDQFVTFDFVVSYYGLTKKQSEKYAHQIESLLKLHNDEVRFNKGIDYGD